MDSADKSKRVKKYFLTIPLLIVGGVVLNWLIGQPCALLKLPLYLNSFGTVLVSIFGGALPAAVLGFVSSAIGGFTDPNRIYFGLLGVLLAISISWLNSRGVFKSILKTAIAIFIIGLCFGALSFVLSLVLYGLDNASVAVAPLAAKLHESGLGRSVSLFLACTIIEIADKIVVIGISVLIYRVIPGAFREKLEDAIHFGSYRKMSIECKRISLMAKVIVIIILSEILLGTIATVITFTLYQNIAVRNYTEKCSGVAEAATVVIDPEMIDDYLERGRDVPGYNETELKLYEIKEAFPQVEYIYAYMIDEEGCHVVFDLDVEGTEATEIGGLVPFEDSFENYVEDLIAGKEIEPIISNDSYGWLLTVYKPIRNAEGKTVCYVAADIKMDDILNDQSVFVVKMTSLFFGVSIIVVYIIMEIIKYGVIYPINLMARATGRFALDSDEGRAKSLSRIDKLDIDSGDELENLYTSLKKMATDSTQYVYRLKSQSDFIVKMQSAIIWDFAEMVEARDKCTGDHIKTTAAYVEAIAKELRAEGKYTDILTDDYIEKIHLMAPLHDIGKIKISDLILNKPGKLTEEEFELMKTHTVEGRNILLAAESFSRSEAYLKEAIEMTTSHHERWDGKGYPYGLKGEEIPLSARIMAVADVFDALVSKRSYKEPFSYEKATEIIREESGTHFDPVVAEAFLNISKTLYEEIACKKGND